MITTSNGDLVYGIRNIPLMLMLEIRLWKKNQMIILFVVCGINHFVISYKMCMLALEIRLLKK